MFPSYIVASNSQVSTCNPSEILHICQDMYARQDTVLYHNNVHAADVSWFQGILAVFDGIFVLWTSLDIFGHLWTVSFIFGYGLACSQRHTVSAEVTQCVHALLLQFGFAAYFDQLSILALLLGAIVHDMGACLS